MAKPTPGPFDDLDIAPETRDQLTRISDAFLAVLDLAPAARDRRPSWAADVMKLLGTWGAELEDLEAGRVPGERAVTDTSEKWSDVPTRREKPGGE